MIQSFPARVTRISIPQEGITNPTITDKAVVMTGFVHVIYLALFSDEAAFVLVLGNRVLVPLGHRAQTRDKY